MGPIMTFDPCLCFMADVTVDIRPTEMKMKHDLKQKDIPAVQGPKCSSLSAALEEKKKNQAQDAAKNDASTLLPLKWSEVPSRAFTCTPR